MDTDRDCDNQTGEPVVKRRWAAPVLIMPTQPFGRAEKTLIDTKTERHVGTVVFVSDLEGPTS